MTVTSREIEIAANDGKIDAYVAAPASGTGPGVVMVSTIFGVDKDMKDLCDDLAGRGCVALVQNFFWRDKDPGVMSLPADIERAVQRVMRTDFALVMDDLRLGIAAVRSQPECNGKVAVFGFCFGGPIAWRAACDGFGIGAGVSFHGTHVSKLMRPGDTPACPVSFHYGDHDEFAPPEELAAVKKVAEAAGSEFVIHPGAGHGYMVRADRGHYNPEAAGKSWDSALQLVDALRN
jgi:carboxymethylenebutenolidase